MHPGVLVYAIKALKEVTDGIIESQKIEKAGETIMACSVVAAVAGVGSGWLPGAGALVATATWVGTIWTMYIKINKDLGISLKENILKSLASAILTNIIAGAGAFLLALAAAAVIAFIPVVGNLIAMAVDAFLGYVTVFALGVLYIKLLTKMFKARKSFDISENEIEDFAKDIVDSSDIQEILKDGKRAFKKDKKAGKFKK